MYKTVIVKYSPKAKEMASKIEETANEMEKEGFELISCSIMPSSKGIFEHLQLHYAPVDA